VINVALVGYGYWGAKIAERVSKIDGCVLTWVVDIDARRRAKASQAYPHAAVTGHLRAALDDRETSCVFLATPPGTHYYLGSVVLDHQKSVMVEKPLALNFQHATEMVALSKRVGAVLSAGHTYLYSPVMEAVVESISRGDIGRPVTLHSVRSNFGRHQKDANVLWILGPHEITIGRRVFGEDPHWVSAVGVDHLGRGMPETANLTLGYGDSVAFSHLRSDRHRGDTRRKRGTLQSPPVAGARFN
jgi:predicted dehydrogenase